MSSAWGRNIKISIFGESHGQSVGVVVDGLPSGIALDMKELQSFMSRRAPGNTDFSTPRKEADIPKIQSGLYKGFTTGSPLCAVIENTNISSRDYDELCAVARPAHADYTGFLRYSGYNDNRGGGHFSGRLTAPLVFAGGVAKQVLAKRGIIIGGNITSVKDVTDCAPDSLSLTAESLQKVMDKPFPVFDDGRGRDMIAQIENARQNQDSVGGTISCYALGLPAGIGSPMFDGVENAITSLIFGIPGVKGVEFGSGFVGSGLFGSENNDPMRVENGTVIFDSNNHGGTLGGITSGAPLVLRVAIKPTPSISRIQSTVDYLKLENTVVEIKGRHDPCIVPRAVPCVEACVALAILDLVMEGGYQWI